MSGASSTPAANYTVSGLIGLALRQLGVGAQGTVPQAADLSDGVLHLNLMLAQWQRRRWLVPTLVDLVAVSTGFVDLFVGPGRDFDTSQRPDRIEVAFARYLGTGTGVADFGIADFDQSDFETNGLDAPGLAIDYPLTVIESREDYSAISIKNLRTFPYAAFYAPEYPVGRLNVWPIPAAGKWEIHLVCKQVLSGTLALTDILPLPPEFWDAIMWKLAARMAPSYGQEASPTVAVMARAALDTIRTANVAIPSLSLPSAVMRPYGSSIPGAYIGGGLV